MRFTGRGHMVLALSLIGPLTGSLAASLAQSSPAGLTLSLMVREAQDMKQRQSEPEAQSETETIERDIQQALQLLNQALVSVKELADPVDCIRSNLAIGETLWNYEPPRTRDLFRQAWEEVERIPKEKRLSAPRTPIVSQRSPDLLRREILRRAAALDLALATDLAQRLPEETDEPQTKSEASPAGRAANPSERAERLLALALTMLESDPVRAATLARESLAGGVTPNFIGFISELRKQHRELADDLYQTALPIAVRQARQDIRALYLLGSYVLPGIPLPMRFGIDGEASPVDPAQAQQYLGILVEVLAVPDELAGADSRPGWFPPLPSRYTLLQQLEPLVTRYAPEKVLVLEAALEAMRIRLSQQGQPAPPPPSSSDKRGPEEQIDELLAQAERTSSNDERDSLYVRAIDVAVTNKLLDRARKLVAQVSDLALRSELTDYILYSSATQAADQNDVEAAKSYAAEIRQPERLALAFIHIANQQSQKNREAAIAILGDAAQRIHRLQTSPEKARSLLRLAEAMLVLDAARAFDLLGAAIPVFNATDAPTEVIEGVAFVFKTKRYTKAVGLSQPDLSGAIEKVMSAVGQKEVNLALLLSGQWTNPGLRILAQVAAARGILDAAKKQKQMSQ